MDHTRIAMRTGGVRNAGWLRAATLPGEHHARRHWARTAGDLAGENTTEIRAHLEACAARNPRRHPVATSYVTMDGPTLAESVQRMAERLRAQVLGGDGGDGDHGPGH